MSRSSLEKFRRRLALVAYFRKMFGFGDFEDLLDPRPIGDYYAELDGQEEDEREGYTAEGLSHVYRFLAFKADTKRISEEQLFRYDRNIKEHLEKMNKYRSELIIFKPFQMLAAFMTEAYLDRVSNDLEGFKNRLNEFVENWNEKVTGRIKFPHFTEDDLNKVAFWMATGSGKTLLMHMNYYQYLHYAKEKSLTMPENILLVTTNKGLSKQHIKALRRSGIPCRHFNAETVSLHGVGANPVKVIEIHKLVEEKTGEGLSVEVDSFEGRNLVFVDEGHAGTTSTAQSWRRRREAIAREGFTFEYSATFGQAIAGAGTDIEEEYGKAILVDYSYPRFYLDGYGKDYHILNLETDIDSDLRDHYLLANLLTFYEQLSVFEQNKKTFHKEWNIHRPLLIFVGHTVTAGKTRSNLNQNDEQSISDVEDLLLFLSQVLENEGSWVPDVIEDILRGNSSLIKDSDIFEDSFSNLRKANMTSEEMYQDILDKIFQSDNASQLEVVDIKNAEGEIGLRSTSTGKYFGVINIGNDKVFLDKIGDNENLSREEDWIKDTLFYDIDKRGSNINILLGSRKFIQGWDSWRVSTMGLMNFGRGEGPQVIQLFGRGVRLKGKDKSLKRSSAVSEEVPNNLPILEMLNIFGIRADYMARFRDYLTEEGIDTEPVETIKINTQKQEHFHDKGLLIIRQEDDTSFDEEQNIRLKASELVSPTVDLEPRIGAIMSKVGGEIIEQEQSREPKPLPERALPLLDWNYIYQKIWRFRDSRGYKNFIAEREVLKEILQKEYYTLYCPDEMLEVSSFEGLKQIRNVALMVLRSYVENFYGRQRKQWEEQQLTYRSVDTEMNNERNIIDYYVVKVKASATEFLEELREAAESEDLYTCEEGLPKRVHFDRHLYLPLIIEESGIHEDEVSYHPPGLNKGEKNLVEKIRSFFTTNRGEKLLKNWEVFLLRNRSRGHGVGFLAGEQYNQNFFPDFILWLKSKDYQHIIFLEPHGLALEGEPLENYRVKFHNRIKAYEEVLTDQSESNGVSLHSYVISRTPFENLKRHSRAENQGEFHEEGIFFPDDGLDPILQDVLNNSCSSD